MFRCVNIEDEIKKDLETNPEVEQKYVVEEQKFEFIRELVKIRKSLNLSQQNVADKSGLSRQQVSRIENFDNSPTLDNLLKYVNAIGAKINIKN